jgi:hypothetical protein
MPCSAAVLADTCQSLLRPSVAGTRTGHKNTMPDRVMQVYRQTMKHSLRSSGTATRSTITAVRLRIEEIQLVRGIAVEHEVRQLRKGLLQWHFLEQHNRENL